MGFEIEFTPESEEDKEEARRQRFANLTDRSPELAQLMNGRTWQEIYNTPAGRLILRKA